MDIVVALTFSFADDVPLPSKSIPLFVPVEVRSLEVRPGSDFVCSVAGASGASQVKVLEEAQREKDPFNGRKKAKKIPSPAGP